MFTDVLDFVRQDAPAVMSGNGGGCCGVCTPIASLLSTISEDRWRRLAIELPRERNGCSLFSDDGIEFSSETSEGRDVTIAEGCRPAERDGLINKSMRHKRKRFKKQAYSYSRTITLTCSKLTFQYSTLTGRLAGRLVSACRHSASFVSSNHCQICRSAPQVIAYVCFCLMLNKPGHEPDP